MNPLFKRVKSKMGRKPISSRGTKLIGTNMEIGLLESLDAYCEAKGRSRSRVIDDAVTEWLKGNPIEVVRKPPLIMPPPVTGPVNYQEQP